MPGPNARPWYPLAIGLVLMIGTGPVYGQDRAELRGVVEDAATGRPLAHAQVYLLGTSAGTTTDAAGRYRLRGLEPGSARLRVDLLGYRSAEVPVTPRAGDAVEVDVDLEREHVLLDQIVVTGTADRARGREVAHGVVRIVPSEIAEPVATVDELLAGLAPGVTVLQSSGMAGAGSQIRLRGNVSVALGNDPLVYVDGVRVRSEGYPKNAPRLGDDTRRSPNETASPIDDLDPDDIERIEIVRGPAAATLYGAEAATGVIQIFTRRGTSPRPVWTARVDQGFDRVLEFGTDARPYMGLDPWLDGMAWNQRYGLSVARGGEFGYYASTSLDRTDGLLPNDRSERFSARANLDFRGVDDLVVRWSSSHTANRIDNTPAGPNSHGLTLNAYRGADNYLGDSSVEAVSRLLEYDIDTDIDHTLLGLTAVHTPTPRWTNRLTLGYDRAASRMRQLRPVGFVLAPDGILYDESWSSEITTLELVGSYHRGGPDRASGTVTWGAQNVTTDVESDRVYAEGFEAGRPATPATARLALDERLRTRVRVSGLFAETTLGYRDRYFVTGGLRFDGSTAFGDRLGWQAYPRIGASYVLSEEPFWPSTWGRLKLRASRGHAGRSPDAIDAVRTWNEVDHAGEVAYVPGTIGNPDLAPERTIETEIGLEGAFFGGRLSVDLGLYRQRTTDALFPVVQVPSEGFAGQRLENVGTLTNRGVEFSVQGVVFRGERVGWDVGAYLYTHRSEVTDLGGAPPLRVGDVGWILDGLPAPVLRGTRVRNRDEVAEPDLVEEAVWGPNLPTRTVGMKTSLRLPAGVEVEARGEYMGGHYVHDHISNHLAKRELWPVCADAYATTAAGGYDRLTAWERTYCVAENVPETGPIYPADFFRFRSLTLRTPVPSPFGANAMLTLSARNFWTWKNEDFLVFDPEMVGQEGMHTRLRTIEAHVPPPATFTLSLRLVR
ncbi:MAG: TonB-dependent receptor [Gemmatimonadota bacterium]|nr:TonB-dependent receptor [Gemmatimonadota bacterium]